ncbi:MULTISPECIES: hypothetical protein [Haloarcula]|uniref:hypothetical protein n=1 Tax=Haloarcula TaxID=2237 RepID=UPI0023EB141D|nr:hypothetical protein [Halomicroarcula sp. XH51]
MDEPPADAAEESGEWAHPSPAADAIDSETVAEMDPAAVTSEDVEATLTESMPEPPKLPDALFERDLADDQRLYWHLREDANVLVMANGPIEREHYREVTTTPLVRTHDGDLEWEIPARLIRGHATAIDGPEEALIQPGRAIHFRASAAMLDGETRTCYAMTTDRLEQLTG